VFWHRKITAFSADSKTFQRLFFIYDPAAWGWRAFLPATAYEMVGALRLRERQEGTARF
jgi:hypothetical protein